MARPRSGTSREEKEAVAALDGQRTIDVRQLIELIRAVNPTGHELPASETQRRYALKSRLQSLLVRGFGEELTIESDAGDPAVVLLRHLGLDAEACHAVLRDG